MSLFRVLIVERRVATVAMLVVLAIGVLAGRWQLSRADQKIILANQITAMADREQIDLNAKNWTLLETQFRPVRARGRFLVNEVIWLDNRPNPKPQAGQTQSGFYVLMPFLLDGQEKRIVWVNRGWAPRNNQDRLILPSIKTPEGSVMIEGIALSGPGKVLELGNQPNSERTPRIQQNLDLTYEASRFTYPQSPFIIRQNDPDTDDGLSRIWPVATTGVDRHYAYAFQWFSLGAAALAFWLTTGFMRYRNQGKSSS